MRRLTLAILLMTAGLPGGARAAGEGPVDVVTTTTDLAWLVREIGGDRVRVETLASSRQDLHTVSPTPSLMMRARRAEILFKVGMQLEPWLEPLLQGTRNPRILPGRAGHVDCSEGIEALEIPERLDRSEGDVHPEGNPHVWLDPLNVRRMAGTVAEALAAARPDGSERFEANLIAFRRRLDVALFGQALVDAAGGDVLVDALQGGTWEGFLVETTGDGAAYGDLLGGWLARARPIRGTAVVEYHNLFAYLAHRFGFEIVGTIEPKPGIPPTPGHVRDLIGMMRTREVPLILSAVFYERSVPDRVAERTGARLRVLPMSVGAEEGIDDYFDLVDRIVESLVGTEGG